MSIVGFQGICFVVAQVRQKVHIDILCSYVGRVMYRPIVFHRLYHVLGFGIIIVNNIERNLFNHFYTRWVSMNR